MFQRCLGPEHDLKLLPCAKPVSRSNAKDVPAEACGELVAGTRRFTANAPPLLRRVHAVLLMPSGDTGRGTIMVLGMPFLRAFYTAYDVETKQIGFSVSKHGKAEGEVRGAAEEKLIALREHSSEKDDPFQKCDGDRPREKCSSGPDEDCAC